MAHWLDNLALSVAEESPRRLALRKVGAGLAGAIGLLVLGGGRASAEEDEFEEEEREKNRCQPGSVRCGTTCAVVAIDPDNCGGCGITCAIGQVCRHGQCLTECPPASCNTMQCPSGQTACGAACCQAGQSCVNGMCQTTCP